MVKRYYEILGVSEDASQDEINKAYRKLSFKWHPDFLARKSKEEKEEANKKMAEINQAYEVLKDEKKKKYYDNFGDSSDSKGFGGGFGESSSNSDIEDILQNFFGFNSGSRSAGNSGYSQRENHYKSKENRQKSPDDILISINLSFRESVLGIEKEVDIPLKRSCLKCNQKGYESFSDVVVCPNCRGSGSVFTSIGFFQMNTSCSRCFGTGQFVNKKCSVCSGRLFINRREKIKINIPRGIQLDKRIRYQGVGNDGINSKRGDVYVDVKIEKHSYYYRKGNDIYTDLPISFLDAILGSIVEVITLEGIEKIIVPKGTQNNDYVVINNKGCYLGINKSSRGNFYIIFQIKIPRNLSEWSRNLLQDLKINTEKSWNPNRDFIEKNKNIL